MDLKTLENWLWEAACRIRGEVDALKYKDYILQRRNFAIGGGYC